MGVSDFFVEIEFGGLICYFCDEEDFIYKKFVVNFVVKEKVEKYNCYYYVIGLISCGGCSKFIFVYYFFNWVYVFGDILCFLFDKEIIFWMFFFLSNYD